MTPRRPAVQGSPRRAERGAHQRRGSAALQALRGWVRGRVEANLDFLLTRGLEVSAPGVGRREDFAGLSEHLPVWATVHLP